MRVLAAFSDRRSAARAAARLRHSWPVELYGAVPTGTAPGRPQLARRIHLWACGGALLGAGIALFVQWWTASKGYPLLIGGRGAPSFISYLPPAFAIAMFWSALGAVAAFLTGAKLPRLHNPLFDSALFDRIAEGSVVVAITCGEAPELAEDDALALGAAAIDRVPT